MSNYLVLAPNDVRGHVYLGTHNASNPENAVQRARENYEAENLEQELAIIKANKFKVYKIEEMTRVETS